MNVCTECGVRVIVIEGVDVHMTGCSLSTPESVAILESYVDGAENSATGMLVTAAGDRGRLAALATMRANLDPDNKDDQLYVEALKSEPVQFTMNVAALAGATQMFSVLLEQGLIDEKSFINFELQNMLFGIE